METKGLGVMLGGVAAVAGLAYTRSKMSGSLSEQDGKPLGKWYIKNPYAPSTSVAYGYEEDIPPGATSSDDYNAMFDEAARQRSVVFHNAYNRPTGVCSFCGGPTPCLRDD